MATVSGGERRCILHGRRQRDHLLRGYRIALFSPRRFPQSGDVALSAGVGNGERWDPGGRLRGLGGRTAAVAKPVRSLMRAVMRRFLAEHAVASRDAPTGSA